MQQAILHIPHSSTVIPLLDGFVVSRVNLKSEILKLTDWYTDDIFNSPTDIIMKAEFSRIFCDVERFAEDSQEIMAQYGMGVIYAKTDDGLLLRKINSDLRKRILKNYYWIHHSKLSQEVKMQLELYGEALIIDCHSFSNIPFNRDLNKDSNRPDFNIGTDPYHTPKILVDKSREFFKEKGFSLGIDWPYCGSIVPLEYYQTNKKVSSIMLEINRKLYLQEPTNQKSENYSKIKSVTNEFINIMNRSM